MKRLELALLSISPTSLVFVEPQPAGYCPSEEYSEDTVDDEDDSDRLCVGEDRVSDQDIANFNSRLIDRIALSRKKALDVARSMIRM